MTRIVVDPVSAPVDTPLRLSLAAFPPRTAVTVRTATTDPGGRSWVAHARYRTDARGDLDLTTQAPLAGSYAGVDGMGLIWSMRPNGRPDRSRRDRRVLPPAPLTISAEVGGRLVAETVVERLRLPAGVARVLVRGHGLVGTLFLPATGGPYPGVLLLGGSEGGLHELDAALLARHGYAVLALAYFGMRGVGRALVRIPLEYFETALAVLARRGRVDPDRLAVLGGSRGAEAALLLAATCARVRAVVSIVGSGVITQAITEGGGLLEILERREPAWTHRGRPLPFLPSHLPAELREQVAAGVPVDLSLAFRPGLTDPAAVAAATIPVEHIQGAVLLVSAGDDRIWPCEPLSAIAERRLAASNHRFPYRHVTFPEAGHSIAAPPYGSATALTSSGPGVRFATGGTPATNAAARAEAWREIREFLAEHLA